MPAIKLQHIVSVTSEDKNFQAENLLKGDSFKKWKSQNVGEKNVSVTIQFEKASKIHQIDVGNEGSAFVEVLVGKSSTKDDDYKVVLVTSSFMSPIESRNNQNLNKVRMFGPDQLNKAVADENWDRVKIVCSQPFNKSSKYGLAFIKFHAPTEPGEKEPPKTQTTLGAFRLKDDKADDKIKPGSLFANRAKVEKNEPSLTGAAAIRAASKLPADSAPAVKETITPVKRKSSDGARPETKKPKRDPSPPPKPSASDRSARDRSSESRTPVRRQSSVSSTTSHPTSSSKITQLKRVKSEADKGARENRFDKIMKKVVFVLSGFQNPLRSQLRDSALEMGATYKPDWGKNCTHLICAFKNTPKYNQVNGKGRIVSSDFIDDCYKAKKLLPWRDYRLGKSKSPPPTDSDTEEEECVPIKKARKGDSPKKAPTPKKISKEEDSGDDTDVYEGYSEEDTDDEIQRVKAEKAKEEKVAKEAKAVAPAAVSPGVDDTDDPYNAPTDEEDNAPPSDVLPELPNFFSGKKFFIYGKIEADTRRTIKRYVMAYDGILEGYMSEKINFVITESKWDDNFDQATLDNPSLNFVRPDWVMACHDKQKIVPFQRFLVVPI